MTSADILSPAQVKRWLLSCYRPIHWHDLCEVDKFTIIWPKFL